MAQYTVEIPGVDELFPVPSARDLIPPHQRIHEALEALGVGPWDDPLCIRVAVELDWRQATFLAALLERAHRADTSAGPNGIPA